MNKHFLHSSEIIVSSTPSEVTTVLGSCISVCLLDKRLNIGGINHFMLPLWNGEGLATPKYGNIAIIKLIEKMKLLGAELKNIDAKIFGGAAIIGERTSGNSVGEKNVLIAQDILQKFKIPIIATSIHGYRGRKILFLTHNGSVYMKYVNN